MLDDPEERLHLAGEEYENGRGDQQQREHGQRQAGAGTDHQDQAAHHQQRRARANAQRHLGESLQGGYIAGQAHHQLAGILPVEVAERKGLDLEKKRIPQIARHAFPHLNRQDAVSDRDHGA